MFENLTITEQSTYSVHVRNDERISWTLGVQQVWTLEPYLGTNKWTSNNTAECRSLAKTSSDRKHKHLCCYYFDVGLILSLAGLQSFCRPVRR